ncbi:MULTISPECIES: hypothetical protein [Enterobacterales]|uniref:hypothetical protein n=1 Tax=Enterobacterales TaxID=91347 RepID=UPI002ED98DAE
MSKKTVRMIRIRAHHATLCGKVNRREASTDAAFRGTIEVFYLAQRQWNLFLNYSIVFIKKGEKQRLIFS